jgi:hypothetical protein
MRDDSALEKGTQGNQPFIQEASQRERRTMLRQDAAARLRPGDREPTTYAAMAQIEDDLGGRWTEPKYPAGPQWTRDAAALPKERPLGSDINEVMDTEACWWDANAVGPRGGQSDE